nr:hypothetical protein [uncultured bacterium]
MISKRTALAAVFAASAPAHAAVTISTAATQNMSCSSGTCVPTAAKAVLNVSDLESYLSQFGNVHVTTTGTGVEANDIIVRSPFSSPDSKSLTLKAHKAITVNAAVSIGSGTAELELQSDTLDATDALSFGRKGHITFGSLSGILGINGGIFTLVGSVQGLASAVAANPSGAYALANSYDAGQDGPYANSPVSSLSGSFEGLGNGISNLSIDVSDTHQKNTYVGLFGRLEGQAKVSDFSMTGANVQVERNVTGDYVFMAPLAGLNIGTIARVDAGGIVSGPDKYTVTAGGLVGINTVHCCGHVPGLITDSHATADVESGGSSGGLAGRNAGGVIDRSYATGTAQSTSVAGGLVGDNTGPITDCYATDDVVQGNYAGGLVGYNSGIVDASYSTGTVTGGNFVGGLIGADISTAGSLTNTYWDFDTSGITDPNQGAGSPANDPGITGLTTKQFQSGLPTGFKNKIWAEDSSINNGLPYLIHNPPPK